jgi:hypothetical protein
MRGESCQPNEQELQRAEIGLPNAIIKGNCVLFEANS